MPDVSFSQHGLNSQNSVLVIAVCTTILMAACFALLIHCLQFKSIYSY